jgi:hypothetical protein
MEEAQYTENGLLSPEQRRDKIEKEVRTHEEAMESLKAHHYVIEKSGDKMIYHFDLIGSDGTRMIRSKELTDSEAINDPAIQKSRLDAFIDKLDKNRLPPK